MRIGLVDCNEFNLFQYKQRFLTRKCPQNPISTVRCFLECLTRRFCTVVALTRRTYDSFVGVYLEKTPNEKPLLLHSYIVHSGSFVSLAVLGIYQLETVDSERFFYGGRKRVNENSKAVFVRIRNQCTISMEL